MPIVISILIQKKVSSEELEEMVLELARPSNRILIFVEEVKDGTQVSSIANFLF